MLYVYFKVTSRDQSIKTKIYENRDPNIEKILSKLTGIDSQITAGIPHLPHAKEIYLFISPV